MPAKNTLKTYIDGGFYHVYNRGVEKRIIFEDEQDYRVFLKYLKEVLSPPDPKNFKATFNLQGQSYTPPRRPGKNYCDEIDLLAYCLMPNHFHLIVKQKNRDSLEGFMRATMTRYSMYFNKRYDRVGSLFQGRYKAVLVNSEDYLLHLSRYVHLNPFEYTNDIVAAYSSYADYLGLRKTPWVKPDIITSMFDGNVGLEFKKVSSYKDFVEKYKGDSTTILGNLVLE